ncbi:TetR/AcrR family transcriptional regulator [Szabonella alba]|uniref:TetR/AcrR family transcriptional regulator n=1 Tax=Szabonella alba TaxID=2804194 RepID=A0A8K0XZE9_9RHOB|nr:TetR/AcrR family transcriptional regulator [Szabonella alba]MBL4916726.1 TetR/AcrR family transcriptional regulator [Szabonella alba]
MIPEPRRYTVWSVKSTILENSCAHQEERHVIEHPAPEISRKSDTRRRILDAAEALARCEGSGNLSLDAVAARAGVSKGGLLYHFPSKGRLMEALVEDYLGRFAAALGAEERTGQPDAVIRAYVTQFRTECRDKKKPASGLLAALAEDPDMLSPVRRHESDFLARIRANASDPQMATLAFLAINGLRAMDLLNTQVLPPDEVDTLLDWLGKRLES